MANFSTQHVSRVTILTLIKFSPKYHNISNKFELFLLFFKISILKSLQTVCFCFSHLMTHCDPIVGIKTRQLDNFAIYKNCDKIMSFAYFTIFTIKIWTFRRMFVIEFNIFNLPEQNYTATNSIKIACFYLIIRWKSISSSSEVITSQGL